MNKFEKPRAYKNCNTSEIGKITNEPNLMDKIYGAFNYIYINRLW